MAGSSDLEFLDAPAHRRGSLHDVFVTIISVVYVPDFFRGNSSPCLVTLPLVSVPSVLEVDPMWDILQSGANGGKERCRFLQCLCLIPKKLGSSSWTLLRFSTALPRLSRTKYLNI